MLQTQYQCQSKYWGEGSPPQSDSAWHLLSVCGLLSSLLLFWQNATFFSVFVSFLPSRVIKFSSIILSWLDGNFVCFVFLPTTITTMDHSVCFLPFGYASPVAGWRLPFCSHFFFRFGFIFLEAMSCRVLAIMTSFLVASGVCGSSCWLAGWLGLPTVQPKGVKLVIYFGLCRQQHHKPYASHPICLYIVNELSCQPSNHAIQPSICTYLAMDNLIRYLQKKKCSNMCVCECCVTFIWLTILLQFQLESHNCCGGL